MLCSTYLLHLLHVLLTVLTPDLLPKAEAQLLLLEGSFSLEVKTQQQLQHTHVPLLHTNTHTRTHAWFTGFHTAACEGAVSSPCWRTQ